MIRGTGNYVDPRIASASGAKIEIFGDHNTIRAGPRTHLGDDLLIHMEGCHHELLLGDRCWIHSGALWFEDFGGRLEIGAATSIQGVHVAVIEPGSRVVLGEDCMLADDIDIRSGDSHSIVDARTGERLNPAADVVIGAHVWISAHVRILKGVTIGAHSVIGTGAVVTGDVPEGCLAAGVPAQVVKTGIDWLRERFPAPGSPPPPRGPEYFDAWHGRGRAFLEANRTQEAVESLEQAIELRPDESLARYHLGMAFASIDRLDDSLRSFDLAVELEPKLGCAWYDRGRVLARMGRHDQAVASFALAVRLEPEDARAWYAKALSHLRDSNPAAARQSLERAVALDPEDCRERLASAPELAALMGRGQS